MSQKPDVDRLVRQASQHVGWDAWMMWPIFWCFGPFVLWMFVPGFYAPDGHSIELSRIALAILGSGVLATVLCFLVWRGFRRRKARAAAQLESLRAQAVEKGLL